MRNIGTTLASILRNPLRLGGGVFVLSILFFVMFLLLMLVSFTIQTVNKAESKVEITFFLREDLPEYKVAVLRAQMMKMEQQGQINSFIYRTSEETLQEAQTADPDRFSFLENTLDTRISAPASFVIGPTNGNVEGLIQFFLQGEFSSFIDTDHLRSQSGSVLQTKRTLEFLEFLRVGIVGVILLLLISISIVTGSFISSSFQHRKNEVFIMRLVGATFGFIRLPFLVEALCITAVSLGVGWSIFFVLRYIVLTKMLTIFSSLEEKISVATTVNTMWAEFLGYLPMVFGFLFLFVYYCGIHNSRTLTPQKRHFGTIEL